MPNEPQTKRSPAPCPALHAPCDRSGRRLFKNIRKSKQLYFSTLLCLKQTVREATFRENVIVVACSFSKDCCVFPNQFQFIQTDFFIAVFAGADDIAVALNRRSDNINLDLFFLFGVGSPPLPDLRLQYSHSFGKRSKQPSSYPAP